MNGVKEFFFRNYRIIVLTLCTLILVSNLGYSEPAAERPQETIGSPSALLGDEGVTHPPFRTLTSVSSRAAASCCSPAGKTSTPTADAVWTNSWHSTAT